MSLLFNDSETFQKERPTSPTTVQLNAFYLKMAKEIIKERFSDDDEESIIEDLEGLYPFNDNGFEMAKDLERGNASYDIDVSFCEWLDGLASELRSIQTENVRAWVKAHNPQPKFEKGTKLLINERLCYKMDKGLTVYVNGGRPEEAVYWINTNPEVYGGTVLPYELVEKNCTIA